MSILGVLGKIIAAAPAAIEAAQSVGSAVTKVVRRWRQMPRPKTPWRVQPLPHSSVDHIEEQIRNATSPRAIATDHAADVPKRPGPR